MSNPVRVDEPPHSVGPEDPSVPANLWTLVRALKAAAKAPAGSLEALLASRLQQSALEFASELRDEHARGSQALVALRQLSESPYFSQHPAFRKVEHDLAAAGRELQSMVEGLLELAPTDWIAIPSRPEADREPSAPADDVPATQEESPGSFEGVRAADPEPADSRDRERSFGVSDAVDDDEARSGRRSSSRSSDATEIAVALEAGPTAANLIERGDACWDEGDAEEALACYAEALRLRPNDEGALRRRGRAFAHLGEFAGAIDDFSAVLRFRPGDVEMRLRRADALARSKRPEEAIDDYRVALRQRPEAASARHNMGVALLMVRRIPEAIAAFDLVLAAHPDSAGTLVKRGTAHFALENYDSAVADLHRAAKLLPDDARIRAKLAEALRRQEAALREIPESKTDPSAAASEPDLAAVFQETTSHAEETEAEAATDPEFDVPATAEAPAAPASEPAPLHSEAAPSQTVRVVCPDCGAEGAVRWDKLGKLLNCKGCGQFYRVNPDGSMVRIVQTKPGTWKEHVPPPTLLERLAKHRVAAIAAACAAILSVLLVRPMLSPVAARAVETPLPTELKDRAELLAKAWVRKDLPLMRRMTEPTLERGMFAWLRRHPPPQYALDPSDEGKSIECEVRESHRGGHAVDVSVRIRCANAPNAKAVEFAQRWEERDGVWQFNPGR